MTWKVRRERVSQECEVDQVPNVEKAINNSLRTRFEQFSLDFVIREVI